MSRVENAGAKAEAPAEESRELQTNATTDARAALGSLDALVQSVPVCIVWNKEWAGELGSSVLYRARRVDATSIRVGYFVFWTMERPWGDNTQTKWILPALAIDAVYTRFLFVRPGLQSVLYGAGDVEGARVTYRYEGGGRITPVSIVADNGVHQEVSVDVRDAVDDQGRVMFFTDVWSHQLGGRGARAALETGASRRCYVGDSLRRLTSEVASAFRLGTSSRPRRARPAWRF